MKRRPLVLIVLGVGALWLAVGLLVAPPIIEAAHAGRGPAFLRRLLADYPGRSLAFFLAQWRAMVWYGAGAGFLFTGFAWLLRRPSTARRFVGRATPGALGALRIIVCGVLLMNALWEDLPSTAALPRGLLRSMGVMDLFWLVPGFEAFAASPSALGAFQALTVALLALGLVGWRTRYTLPLAALCYFVFGGLLRQYTKFFHTGLLPLYLLALLCVLPAGHGASADRLRRLWKGRPVPEANRATYAYGWARYAVWTVMALYYAMAGLSKLRNSGLGWAEATNFKYILFYSVLRPMAFDFKLSLMLTSAPDVLFEALALTALAGELCYASVLFSRRARWVLPALIVGMHAGILLLQNILFFDLILLQAVFINFRGLRKAAGRWWAARRGRIRWAYDAGCAGQARLVRVLSALDLFERFTFAPREGAALTAAYRGATYRGPGRWPLAARAVPLLWPLAPLLHLPGAARGASRLLLRPTTQQERRPQKAQLPRRRAAWWGTSRLTLAAAGVLFACWTVRIEVYPFSAMQMFSKTRGPVVVYETSQARLQNGAAIETPFAESIGAMADSRYRRLLEMAFEEEEADVTRAFMAAVAERWNRSAAPERRIAEIVVRRWRWDYKAAPDDPNHGRVVARRVYPVTPSPAMDDRASTARPRTGRPVPAWSAAPQSGRSRPAAD